MNTYNADRTAVVDANGKEYQFETPYPLPLPDGIEQCGIGDGTPALVFGESENGWTDEHFPGDTHWLARKPLPPVPKPKPQWELDEEAFKNWWNSTPNDKCPGDIWQAAIAYERSRNS